MDITSILMFKICPQRYNKTAKQSDPNQNQPQLIAAVDART